jgi:hypothetical protein
VSTKSLVFKASSRYSGTLEDVHLVADVFMCLTMNEIKLIGVDGLCFSMDGWVECHAKTGKIEMVEFA